MGDREGNRSIYTQDLDMGGSAAEVPGCIVHCNGTLGGGGGGSGGMPPRNSLSEV